MNPIAEGAATSRPTKEKVYETARGVKLHCLQQGDGDELIVFLHAVGGDSRSWMPQMERFQQRYTCISFDMQGHGRSIPGADTSACMNDFAIDTIDLIAASGYSKAHLVGLSMGGVVALAVLDKAPDLVQSLVLANSWYKYHEASARIQFMEERLSRMSLAQSSRELIPGLFGDGADPSVVEAMIESEGSKNKDYFLESWRSMFEVDFTSLLQRVYVPTLLIGGSKDEVTPLDPLLTGFKQAVPTARIVEIEAAGHFSNLDHPVEFNSHLAIHLRRSRIEGGTRLVPKAKSKNSTDDCRAEIAAHKLIRRLGDLEVDCFFSNSGTDFTPIIDGLALYHGDADFNMRTVVVPHENTSVAMAHGYYLLSKKAQVVMAHVSVGTANSGLGIINASRSRIPMLIMSGKTPWYDSGKPGCRTNFVQWGQDTFDQAAYFREYTKWDYELKGAHHIETVVDRAFATAQSDPQGPVYLTLPKEALCEKIDSAASERTEAEPAQRPARLGCAPSQDIERAARMILEASNPILITAEAGRYSGAPFALQRLCRTFAIPVIEHGKKNFFNYPTSDEMHLGFSPSPHVEEADLIISVESHVPYIPALSSVTEEPPMIHIGVDPLCQNLPMRAFRVDCALAGDPVETVNALSKRLEELALKEPFARLPLMSQLAARREEVGRAKSRNFSDAREAARADGTKSSITKEFISYCIGQAVDDDVVIFNEYMLNPFLVDRDVPDTWFENSIASGLGWSLGAALGAQLASPDQTMLVALGDGTYIFNTPLSAHYVAAAYDLPIVIVVYNDSAWSTIKKSYRGGNPDGWGVKKGIMPLCDFDLTIDFEKLAEATGGIGMRVEKPDELLSRLEDAIKMSRKERKHVLVNVICQRDA